MKARKSENSSYCTSVQPSPRLWRTAFAIVLICQFCEIRPVLGVPAEARKSESWRPQGDSNPCFRRERAVSWTRLDDGDVYFKDHYSMMV